MTKGIYVILKDSSYQESHDEWASQEKFKAIHKTASETGSYQGHLRPLPKEWKIEGDEAHIFDNGNAAVEFIRQLYTSWKGRYIDFATIISSNQVEKRKSERRNLLSKLLRR